MTYFLFDAETYLIEPGVRYPKLVCMQYAVVEDLRRLSISRDDVRLCLSEDALHVFRAALDQPVVFVGHRVDYDMGVMCAADNSLIPHVFRAYMEGRVLCTRICEQLLRISVGDDRKSVSLAACVERYTGEDISSTKKGDDIWRLRYAELDGVPIAQWPQEAIDYALDDIVHLYAVLRKQQELASMWSPSALEDAFRQTRAAWAFSLAEAWGIQIDAMEVAHVKEVLEAKLRAEEFGLVAVGINRPDGTRDTKRLQEMVEMAFASRSREPPRTPTGLVKTDRLTLLQSEDPILRSLVDYNGPRKLLTSFIPALEKAAVGRGIVNPGFNPLVNSGRSSCGDPNVQNIAKSGGMRECFVPREGCCFVFCDYDTLEMRTLAQVLLLWFGQSSMADAINAGKDLHVDFASMLLGVSYEEAERRHQQGDPELKRLRQFAKVANFGFPGGLGEASFVDYAFAWGIETTSEYARYLRNAWLTKWPEMRLYFRRIGEMAAGGEFSITQMYSGRYRGGCTYTSACNSFFQGLAADGAKDALFHVSYEAYSLPESPLYGTRPVLFIHDEIGIEVPLCLDVNAAAHRLSGVMVDRMQRWVPDVRIAASPVAATRWSKSAKAVRDEHGRLIPYHVPSSRAA